MQDTAAAAAAADAAAGIHRYTAATRQLVPAVCIYKTAGKYAGNINRRYKQGGLGR